MYSNSVTRKLLALAFVYFSVTALLQYILSGVADLDQAEQLLTSQEIAIGYGHQPPFYSWITYLAGKVFTNSLATVLVVKVVVLTMLAAGILKISTELKLDSQRTLIAFFGCWLLPQLIWESQRDLTHSVLATALASWFLAAALQLRNRPNWRNYLLIGIIGGAGSITKYNFTLLPVALLLATVISKSDRSLLFTPKLLITLMAGAAISLPHFGWVLQHTDVALQGVSKLGEEASPLTGVGQLFLAILFFLTPFWLVYLTVLPKKGDLISRISEPNLHLLLRITLSIIVLLLMIVILKNATNFKDRWLMPLLLSAPIILGAIATTKRSKIFIGVAVLLAMISSVLLTIRAPLAQSGAISPDRSAQPFQDHFTNLTLPSKPGYILSDDKFTGGNAKIYFPDAVVFVPEFYSLNSDLFKQANRDNNVLIICKSLPCGLRITPLLKQFKLASDSVELNESVAYFDKQKKLANKLYWAYFEK